MNTERVLSKQPDKTLEKALVGVASPIAADHFISLQGSDSGNSRYSEEEEVGVSSIGKDKEADPTNAGEGSGLTHTPLEGSSVRMQDFCLRCQGFGHLIDVCTSPASLYNGDPRILYVFAVASLGTCKIHVKTLSTGGVADRFGRARRAAKSSRRRVWLDWIIPHAAELQSTRPELDLEELDAFFVFLENY